MISPKSRIDSNCVVAPSASVWYYAVIIRGAVVSDDCVIGAHAIVDAAKIGRGCRVGAGAQLHPGLEAGEEVFFGPGCIICNDPWPRVRKGDFDAGALIRGEFTTVRIGSNASIGAGAIVLPGVEIGAGAMVAAGAVVDCSVGAGFLYKRDGEIVEIGRRQVTRMRAAGSAGCSR